MSIKQHQYATSTNSEPNITMGIFWTKITVAKQQQASSSDRFRAKHTTAWHMYLCNIIIPTRKTQSKWIWAGQGIKTAAMFNQHGSIVFINNNQT